MGHASDRDQTRLIIVEGIMGSGKSTTCQFLEGYLQNRGISARFLPEWVMPHPIRVDDALPHPYEPWRDVTIEEYLERSRVRWHAFVEERRFAATVTVLDGQLFHGDLTNLFMMGASHEVCDRHVEQVTRATAPLRPAVIYFAASDVPRALGVVFRARGKKWEKYQVDWKTHSPYCQQRGLSGYDGLLRMYLDYRALTDGLFAALPMRKLQIDPSDGDWPRYQERIRVFLDAATPRGTAGDGSDIAQ
jgi:hypothetical protein